MGQPRRVVLSAGIFGGALVTSALGILPVQVAFVAAAVAMLLANLLTLEEAYDSVDWSIIILLGAMLPVGEALEVTGGADLIAQQVLVLADQSPTAVTLAIVLVGTMFLSDLINNAAAAVLMAPIAVTVAERLQASPDPFLMCVAVGASCAFLTPIGHQSNTLVMGSGRLPFWRLLAHGADPGGAAGARGGAGDRPLLAAVLGAPAKPSNEGSTDPNIAP